MKEYVEIHKNGSTVYKIVDKDIQMAEAEAKTKAEYGEDANLYIVDEILREGFTQVPNKIINDPEISMAAKVVYIKLLSYAWDKSKMCVYPGQETLAKDLGATVRTVYKYLHELKEKGLITWKQIGLNKTNRYYIFLRRTGKSVPVQTGKGLCIKSGKTFPTNNTKRKAYEGLKTRSEA